MSLNITVNFTKHQVESDPATPLLYVLRNELGLTGAKLGCGLEQCGSCAVLVDGKKVLSCARPVAEFADRGVVTIEGLGGPDSMSSVQQAFAREGAAQCGYCTPGIIVAVTALLHTDARPSDSEIKAALHDHLCRCGSHGSILRAVKRAIEARDGS